MDDMGVGRIVSRRVNARFFYMLSKTHFSGGAKVVKLYHRLETKMKTFFYWEVDRKVSNFKIQNGPRPSASPSEPRGR